MIASIILILVQVALGVKEAHLEYLDHVSDMTMRVPFKHFDYLETNASCPMPKLVMAESNDQQPVQYSLYRRKHTHKKKCNKSFSCSYPLSNI